LSRHYQASIKMLLSTPNIELINDQLVGVLNRLL